MYTRSGTDNNPDSLTFVCRMLADIFTQLNKSHQTQIDCQVKLNIANVTTTKTSYFDLYANLAENIYNIFSLYVQEELTEVVAVCEVEGMEKPLVFSFCCKAKGLSVSYSLPDTDRYSVNQTHAF